jgi:hypothetical protein
MMVVAGVMARRSSFAKDTGRVEGGGMFSRFGVLGFFAGNDASAC